MLFTLILNLWAVGRRMVRVGVNWISAGICSDWLWWWRDGRHRHNVHDDDNYSTPSWRMNSFAFSHLCQTLVCKGTQTSNSDCYCFMFAVSNLSTSYEDLPFLSKREEKQFICQLEFLFYSLWNTEEIISRLWCWLLSVFTDWLGWGSSGRVGLTVSVPFPVNLHGMSVMRYLALWQCTRGRGFMPFLGALIQSEYK